MSPGGPSLSAHATRGGDIVRISLRRPRPDIRPKRRTRFDAPYQASRHQAELEARIRIM